MKGIEQGKRAGVVAEKNFLWGGGGGNGTLGKED